MNRDLRTVTTWLLHGVHSAPPSVVEAAQRIAKPKRKAPPRPPAPRNRTAEARKESRPERMREIRLAVKARHEGRCVVCSRSAPATGECHHLISGSGRRIPHEKADTCVWVCGAWVSDCHDLAATDPDALKKIAAYCIAHDMPEAARAVSRRLDKVLEARRSPEQRSAR